MKLYEMYDGINDATFLNFLSQNSNFINKHFGKHVSDFKDNKHTSDFRKYKRETYIDS